MQVDLTISAGALSGTSEYAARSGSTLALIGDELIAYENATLITGNIYHLTGIQRGLGGTPPSYHPNGTDFYRIDGAAIKYDLPPNLIGKQLYLKFQSFNGFGRTSQDLSTCAVYTYTPVGLGVDHPILAQLESGAPVDLGDLSTAVVSDDFGDGQNVAITQVISGLDLGVDRQQHILVSELLASIPVDLGDITEPVTIIDDFGSADDSPSADIVLGTVP